MVFKSQDMASKVTFDTSDPEVKSMVDGWADGREYEVTLTVRSGKGDRRNVCEVLDVEHDGEAEPEAEEEEKPPAEPESPAYSPKPTAPKE